MKLYHVKRHYNEYYDEWLWIPTNEELDKNTVLPGIKLPDNHYIALRPNTEEYVLEEGECDAFMIYEYIAREPTLISMAIYQTLEECINSLTGNDPYGNLMIIPIMFGDSCGMFTPTSPNRLLDGLF